MLGLSLSLESYCFFQLLHWRALWIFTFKFTYPKQTLLGSWEFLQWAESECTTIHTGGGGEMGIWKMEIFHPISWLVTQQQHCRIASRAGKKICTKVAKRHTQYSFSSSHTHRTRFPNMVMWYTKLKTFSTAHSLVGLFAQFCFIFYPSSLF